MTKRKPSDRVPLHILGIDPGITGAIAVIRAPERVGLAVPLDLVDMPVLRAPGGSEVNCHALSNLVRQWRNIGALHGVLERNHSLPREAAKASFTLGGAYHAAKACLACHGVSYSLVSAASWHRHFGLVGRRKDRRSKDASRKLAIERFPGMADQLARVKDHGRAEALLIALYGAEGLETTVRGT